MAGLRPENPLIVQEDHTVLVEVDSPRYDDARDRLARFAELVKSPEHVHTYRITPLSIWNACAASTTSEEIIAALEDFSKYPVPEHVAAQIGEFASRYGRLRLKRGPEGLVLSGMRVESTSGYGRIDRLAMESLKKWRFISLEGTGTQWGVIFFRFVMD